MTTIKIVSRYDSSKVLFECEAANVRAALEKAVAARANLAGANLADANLAGAKERANLAGANLAGAKERANLADANLADANLAGANLAGAYLARANLAGANLAGANLAGAYLARANLAGANLAGANLAGANLAGANLAGANLAGAYLAGAYLAGANLAGAYLADAYLAGANNETVIADLAKVLSAARKEVLGLLRELRAGNVDGSTYEGSCACLVGTIANVRGTTYNALGIDLKPDPNRPVERWFMHIRPGMTPRNSPIVKMTESMIVDWCKANGVEHRAKVALSTRIIWKRRDGGAFETREEAKSTPKHLGKLRRVTIRTMGYAS
jgi:uncharacterized protein YjbI with pentapeptide repeats